VLGRRAASFAASLFSSALGTIFMPRLVAPRRRRAAAGGASDRVTSCQPEGIDPSRWLAAAGRVPVDPWIARRRPGWPDAAAAARGLKVRRAWRAGMGARAGGGALPRC
jgi:hypothetical protein